MAIKTYEAFKAPSPYEQERLKAERMRRYAELLEQQAMEPEGEFTYQGIRAMPSPAAALGKLLSAYQGKKAREKAEEAEARKTGMEEEASRQIMNRLIGGRPVTDANTTPDEFGLAEIATEAKYTVSPELTAEAMRMAMTPQGVGAVRGNPMLAAALQRSMEVPAAEEFYAPIATDKGLVQFGKRGNERVTGYKAPEGAPEAVTPTTIIKDGRRVVVDARTGREIGAAPESNPLVVNYGSPVAGVDEQGNPVFFQPSRTGGPPSMIPGVRPEGKAPTESQSNAMLFAERMAQAEPLFQNPPPTFGSRFKEGLPGGVGNVMITPESRQFFQAERNFINAVLRKESGAVISDTEFENARKQYIPQPGDDDATLELKRQARETAIRQIAAGGGAGYKPPSISGSQIIDLPPRRR